MNTLVVIALFLFLLSLRRHVGNQYASVKFRVRLRNLSTDLARAIESGKIKDSKIARHLSSSIDLIIDQYFFITMFSVFMRSLRISKNARSEEFRNYYQNELKKDKELEHMNRRLSCILIFYLREQHYMSYILFFKPLLFIGGGIVKYRYAVFTHIQSFPVSSPLTSKGISLNWK